ncbi:MAG: serine hydrolase [Actinobacteria bacterium]|nr:serine hydrolase [Actinomycetota bacterium]
MSAPRPDPAAVDLGNWQDAPFNRWGFLHVPELIPSVSIGRGRGPVTDLPRAERELGGIPFSFRGKRFDVGRMLEATFTDGFLVIHDGRLVMEWYSEGMTPDTTHLLMSVSKSLTSALTGVLVGRGTIDLETPVPRYVEELAGSGFEGCTVQHLLDMRAGTRWTEDYEDLGSDARIYEQVMGWRPRSLPDLPPDLYAYMAGLKENARPHGGRFEYRSILTDVLGWVLERAGGASFAELFSRLIWSKLGAEHDATVTIDSGGCALADGGICTTLRDLARFGLLYLEEGTIGGREVVPAEWIRRLGVPDPELVDAFTEAPEAALYPGAMYHDQWWVLDQARGIFAGLGIHGQMVLVHREANAVVAKLSTQPAAYDMDLEHVQVVGSIALCDRLAQG